MSRGARSALYGKSNSRLSKRDILRTQGRPSSLSFLFKNLKRRDIFLRPSPQSQLLAGGLKNTSRLSSVIPDGKTSVAPDRESKNTQIPEQKRTLSFLSGLSRSMRGMTTLPLFLISIICFSAIAFAGNLTPPAGSPAPTMFSLEQIYNSIAGSSYDSSGFSADADGNVHEQLKYIASIISAGYTYGDEDPDFVLTTADGAGNYDATNLTPENVASGVNFGIGQTGTLEEGFEYGDDDPEYVAGTADGAGTLLVNIKSGRNTANTFDVDNYNNGGAPATNRYATSWTKCNSGNSYCGTSDNRASAMDNVTGLIWSYPCSGTNCSNMTDETAGIYNHATALTNCSSKSPWRLPWQQELMMAYINGAYGNNALEPQGTIRHYWSATSDSTGTGSAWGVILSHGGTVIYSKTSSNYMRCVRSAI